jgi:hypothetical protein
MLDDIEPAPLRHAFALGGLIGPDRSDKPAGRKRRRPPENGA